PYLDGITFQFYPDATARTTAIQTGNADFIEYVPAADVEILQTDPNVEVAGGLSANFRSIYFNVERAPFADVNVRRAISYAIDEQAIVELALFGTGGVVATGTTIPASNYYGIESSPYIGRDLEAARAALAESAYPDGFEFDLYVTSTYDFLRTPAEVIQANLADIGITAHIVADDWTIYLPKAREGDFAATVLGESGQGDPDDFLRTPAEGIQANLADIGITANIVAEDWTIYLPKALEGDFAATILGESGQSDPDDFLFNVFYTDNGGNLGNFSSPELDVLLEE